MISLKSILCCQLAEEEEKLDAEIGYQLKRIVAEQQRMRDMIDKRDALRLVRLHLLEGK